MKRTVMIAYTDYKYDARVRREAETLARTGDFQVSIITLKEGHHHRTYESNGVLVYEVNQSKYDGQNKVLYILSYIHFLLRSFVICTWWAIRQKIDFVHIHNMPDFLIFSALVPKAAGSKLVLDIHDSVPETYLSKFSDGNSIMYRLLCLEESVCASLADRIICVNDIQKQAIVDRGVNPEKITISMNTPDPFLFQLNGHKSRSPEDNHVFRMIYHGTIAHRLGVDLVLEALKLLSKEIPGLEFHLWSKAGPELNRIEQLGKQLKISDHLRIIHGGVPLEKLSDALKTMDIGVVSNRKGVATDLMLPVKLMEYVTVGIPVVAPRLKCIQHYFSDKMISFFEPGNVESMAVAIYNLYKSKEKRESQVIEARAFIEQYGWKVHQHELLNMYRTL